LCYFVFSSRTTVFGPSQVEATINQDPDVSSQRTLWGQQGSQVIIVQSDQTQLPQLKRVIVFYRAPAPAGGQGNAQQVVAMKPTLAEAHTGGTGTGGTTGRHGRHAESAGPRPHRSREPAARRRAEGAAGRRLRRVRPSYQSPAEDAARSAGHAVAGPGRPPARPS
jgi:uncharacterized membrane protein (UPF0182 family)